MKCAYGDPNIVNSRGVAILFKKDLHEQIISEQTDEDGRILALDVDIGVYVSMPQMSHKKGGTFSEIYQHT